MFEIGELNVLNSIGNFENFRKKIGKKIMEWDYSIRELYVLHCTKRPPERSAFVIHNDCWYCEAKTIAAATLVNRIRKQTTNIRKNKKISFENEKFKKYVWNIFAGVLHKSKRKWVPPIKSINSTKTATF